MRHLLLGLIFYWLIGILSASMTTITSIYACMVEVEFIRARKHQVTSGSEEENKRILSYRNGRQKDIYMLSHDCVHRAVLGLSCAVVEGGAVKESPSAQLISFNCRVQNNLAPIPFYPCRSKPVLWVPVGSLRFW
ncbi:hypothetical protein SETIT_9G387900v2 [Setaria italica]|uniref:Uncharacterized protein n=1 Tax=Setaria italica TaxID=4555 RepID=A0A368SQA7_SETIT|nr:hypothetical protein SETIT_9G387900v2 [Setaria italica]